MTSAEACVTRLPLRQLNTSELVSTRGFISLVPVVLIALAFFAVVQKSTNVTSSATSKKENDMGDNPVYSRKQRMFRAARDIVHYTLWATGAVGVEVAGAVLAPLTKTLR